MATIFECSVSEIQLVDLGAIERCPWPSKIDSEKSKICPAGDVECVHFKNTEGRFYKCFAGVPGFKRDGNWEDCVKWQVCPYPERMRL
jgi:hypothetical protein